MKLPPAGVWVGRGLAALGLVAVVRAVLAANVWALVAALGGFLAATGLALAPLVRAWLADQPVTVPSDFEHALDLLRRAHGAAAGWAVGLAAGDLEVGGPSDLDRTVRERGAALVQLASADGRAHVAREPAGTYVAVGDDGFSGAAIPDRRRAERAGIAYPLGDGHFVIGALVVTGPPIPPATPAADLLQRLVADLGSRLAAARAVHEAEQRAVRDPLTGLANRREFDHRSAVAAGKPPPLVTLVFVDIDHFKRLNDTLGHQAGDSALRHVADIMRRAVRDNDLVARIGGEEFAIWMPHTPSEVGLEVAGRIRATVESTVWRWSGQAYPLTLSCGVASYPDTVRDLANF